MYVYLIRHGETLWNLQGKTQGAKDIPLTEGGIQQAMMLAERLEREGISEIYSSGLNRSFQTASVIASSLGIQIEKRQELNEINFGVWEGLTRQEIDTNYPGQLESYRSDFEFAPSDGESLNSLQIRIRKFLDEIISKYLVAEKRILIASHAYPIRMLIMELMGLPKEFLWRYQLSNSGISIIRADSEYPYLLCLNDTAHLSKT